MAEWRVWATPSRDGRWYTRISERETWLRIVESRPPVPVVVTEDPAGPYWGWLPAGEDWPVMVQPTRARFEVQFPYGVDGQEKEGRGRVVRLRIERP